jgi:mRNA turnover protein 4
MAFDSRYTSFRFQEHIARDRREQIAKQLAEKKEQQQKKQVEHALRKQQQQQGAATAANTKQTAASASASADSVKPPAHDTQQATCPASGDPQPPVLLLALCGLPASGKSSLARALVSHAAPALEVEGVAPGTEVHHLSFDDVYTRLRDARRQNKQQKQDEQRGPATVTVEHESVTPTAVDRFDPQLWKLSRVVALQWAQAIVSRVRSQASSASSSSIVPPPQLLLLDDNFALRSMRRRVFQLARRMRTAFLQLHVSCEVETAVRRNAQRNEVAKKAKESSADDGDDDDTARHAFPLSAADEADLERLVAAAAALPDSGIAEAVVATLPGAEASEAEADIQSAQESAEYFAVEQDAVSEATIRRMAAAFQPPPTEAAPAASSSASSSIQAGQTWERAAVSFNTDRVTSLVGPVRRIAQALLGPPLDTPADPVVEAARRAAAQQKTEASFVHQLDLTTRQLLNERIARAKADEQTQAQASASTETQAAAPTLVRQIQGWNEVRRLLLSNVKKAGSSEHTLRAMSESDAGAMKLLVQRFQQCLALAESSLARLGAAVASAQQVFVIDASNMPPASKKALCELFGTDSHLFFTSNPLTIQLALLTMTTAEDQQRRGLDKLMHALSTVGNSAIALLCTHSTAEEVSVLLASFRASTIAPLQFARAGFVCPRSYKLSAGELPSHRCPVSLEAQLRRKLGLPTKLVLGRVLLEHDVVVSSKGDKLTPEQCKVLQIFGVKLARCRPRVMCVWKEGGTISSTVETGPNAEQKEEAAHAVSPSPDGEDDEHAIELRAVAAEDDFVDDHDTVEAEEAEEDTW